MSIPRWRCTIRSHFNLRSTSLAAHCRLTPARTVILFRFQHRMLRVFQIHSSQFGVVLEERDAFIAAGPLAVPKLFMRETLELQRPVEAPLETRILMEVAPFPEEPDVHAFEDSFG